MPLPMPKPRDCYHNRTHTKYCHRGACNLYSSTESRQKVESRKVCRWLANHRINVWRFHKQDDIVKHSSGVSWRLGVVFAQRVLLRLIEQPLSLSVNRHSHFLIIGGGDNRILNTI